MMRLDPRLFKSRLAWRFFGTFVACALVPTIVLASISYYRVTRHLEDQAIERLRQSAKTHALSIYERLALAEGLLENMGGLLARTGGRPVALPAIMTERSRAVFNGVALLRGGTMVNAWGSEITLSPKAAALPTTPEAENILVVVAGDGKWPGIALVRRVPPPHERDTLLVATISPSFLWGLEQGTVLASGTEFGAWDDQGRCLFNSLDAPLPLTRPSRADGADMPRGARYLNVRGEPYYGFCWSAFLKPRFHVPYWTIMVVESRDHVLQPLHHFRTVFPLIVLMSLIIVTWLSSRVIRRSLVPIDSLMEGAKHVAAHRFDYHVAVESKDEFQELATTFNRMTDQLGAHIKTLEARSDLDRAILSLLDMDEIVKTSVSHLGLLIPHRAAAISIVDTERSLQGRSFVREGDRDGAITIEPFSLDAEEQERLIQSPSWTLVDASGPCPSYLVRLRRPGVEVFAVFPVWVKNRLFALVSLAVEAGAQPELENLQQVRGFSDHLAVALSNSDLIRELKDLNLGTLHALARTVDAKSPWTAGHSLRVAHLAEEIGKAMGLSRTALDELQRAALLHDIGKIGVPSSILDKAGEPTEAEYDIVKEHPSLGGRILAPIRAYGSIIPAVEQHHERYDGAGYPKGVQGEAIDPMARILSVADTFDAMVSDRPYRRGFEARQAVKIIVDEAGRQFDPHVVEAFKAVVGRIVEYSSRARLTDIGLAAGTAPLSASPAGRDAEAARAHGRR